MPASTDAAVVENGTQLRAVSRHRAFLYVPRTHTLSLTGARTPDFTVADQALGDDFDVYLMHRVHIKAPTAAAHPVQYNITSGTIGRTPSEPGSASKFDIRWLADLREIMPGTDTLSATCDPRLTALPDLANTVAGVLELDSGRILANFPCVNAGEQRFDRPSGPPIERLFACEFVNEIEYPDSTTQATIAITSLDGDVEADVTVTWGSESVLNIRLGHDTLDEIVEVAKNRCLGPADAGTADDDFELHYRVISNPPASGRPVPVATGGQTRHNGCLMAMVK
jgi:hypothetical protein